MPCGEPRDRILRRRTHISHPLRRVDRGTFPLDQFSRSVLHCNRRIVEQSRHPIRGQIGGVNALFSQASYSPLIITMLVIFTILSLGAVITVEKQKRKAKAESKAWEFPNYFTWRYLSAISFFGAMHFTKVTTACCGSTG